MTVASDRLAAITSPDFANGGHRTVFPQACNDIATVSNEVAANATLAATSASGANDKLVLATGQAQAAATSAQDALTAKTAAEGYVAGVTTGSTNSLAYPELVKNLITATDVVDVFVYDTRLDSDGGAWTERCTGSSWYQETLSTATRGVKRAFPKVALIIAQQLSITIYDGMEVDTNGVPRLWMAFSTGDIKMLNVTNGTTPITSIFALNGRLYRGATLRNVVEIDFINDYARSFGVNSALIRQGGIGARNTDVTGWGQSTRVNNFLPSSSVTNVYAACLPGAATDARGLVIPHLLACTTSGFAVIFPEIRNSAQVTLTNGYIKGRITPDNRIMAIIASSTNTVEVGPIPYATVTANTSWRTHRVGSSVITATGGIILPDAVSSGPIDLADGAVALTNRLALIAEDVGDPGASLVASVGPNFTSAWAPQGRTVLATGGHGVTGSAVGISNPITNGDFATGDLTGWTNISSGTGTATVVTNQLNLARVDINNSGTITQAFTTIVGETYIARFNQASLPAAVVQAGTSSGGSQLGVSAVTTTGAQSFQFTATTTTTYLTARGGGTGTAVLDDFSVALVAPSTIGLAPSTAIDVVGTLTRALVATTADLAAWSGFSGSNFLTQAYSSALDFGTGDFSISAWVNVPTGSDNAVIFQRRNAAGNGWVLLLTGTSNAVPYFQVQNSSNTVIASVNSPNDSTGQIKNIGWVFVNCVRRAGVLELWVNGARMATAANTTDVTNTSAQFKVGDTGGDFSIALLRVASVAPTPGQIARMFRDETPLFRAGAKAFLGMAVSGLVKNLSRSKFNNRLAVAMSDGLALFDGLQRVDRFTSATLSPAMASSDVSSVCYESGFLMTDTASNVGMRREAVIGMDRLLALSQSPDTPRLYRLRGVTLDATPLVLSPRISIAERETVVIWVSAVGRVYGGSDTQSLTYERRATYFRNDAGNVTIRGSVQVVGTDVEVTSTADMTLVIDTTAQTVAPQVTGIAATRIIWSIRAQIERNTHENLYEEVV